MVIRMSGWLCKDCSDVSYADFVRKDGNKHYTNKRSNVGK